MQNASNRAVFDYFTIDGRVNHLRKSVEYLEHIEWSSTLADLNKAISHFKWYVNYSNPDNIMVRPESKWESEQADFISRNMTKHIWMIGDLISKIELGNNHFIKKLKDAIEVYHKSLDSYQLTAHKRKPKQWKDFKDGDALYGYFLDHDSAYWSIFGYDTILKYAQDCELFAEQYVKPESVHWWCSEYTSKDDMEKSLQRKFEEIEEENIILKEKHSDGYILIDERVFGYENR